MQLTRIIMGMPVTIEVVDQPATSDDVEKIFDYFRSVDEQFSPFKSQSEVSRYNAGLVQHHEVSSELQEILNHAEVTKKQTAGFFDIFRGNRLDPSGLVKGWAIQQAAAKLISAGFKNFYVDAGGDVQVVGKNQQGQPWRVGIRHPFELAEVVKVVSLEDRGIATSGIYERGPHITNPLTGQPVIDIVSLTVIGPNVYEADRFATAAFAMGRRGIEFISQIPGLEGYVIDREAQATYTPGFETYAI